MILLPQCVARLGDLAGDATRYAAMGGVLIEPPCEEGESWRLVATNGKSLGIVQGPPVEDVEGKGPYLSRMALTAAVEVAKVQEATAIISSEDWKKMMGLRDKTNKDVALLVSKEQVAYALGKQVGQALPLEGRYPDYRGVLPKKLPLFQVRLGARLLAELCHVAAHVVGDMDAPLVLNFYGANDPIGVMARDGQTGITFDGLLMPLTPTSK